MKPRIIGAKGPYKLARKYTYRGIYYYEIGITHKIILKIVKKKEHKSTII